MEITITKTTTQLQPNKLLKLSDQILEVGMAWERG